MSREAEYGLGNIFRFKEAVAFLKGKKALTPDEYKKLGDECRAKAFTAAGYTELEVLQKFLDELSNAVSEGKTKREFKDEMNSFLERNGYKALKPFRADVIFRTNILTAYNAGHYKSMTEAKRLRPFWQYITAGDGEVRESHRAMEGKVYAADDPIWNVWYPPNGFGCRCSVVSLTKAQAERQGIHVSSEPPYEVDTDTGEILYTTPDKGFSNNPARDKWKPDLSGCNEDLKKAFKKREEGGKNKNA